MNIEMKHYFLKGTFNAMLRREEKSYPHFINLFRLSLFFLLAMFLTRVEATAEVLSTTATTTGCNGGYIHSVCFYKKKRDGTYRDLVVLQDGGHYSTADLPSRFGIRAWVGGGISSVKFIVNGQRVTENHSPFTYPGGDAPWHPSPGTYTIRVKAYSRSNAGGYLCDQQTITIHVDQDDCDGGAIDDVVLYKTRHDGSVEDLVSLQNGGTYSLSSLPDHFAMRAVVSGGIESVKLMVNDHAVTENVAPYTYPAGGAMWNPAPGTYNIWVKAYSQDNLGGTQCDNRDFTIHIVEDECDGGTIDDIVFYKNNSDGSITDLVSLEHGGTYSLSDLPADFAMRAIVSGNVESVKLMVDDHAVVENVEPYTYPAGNANWNPAPGTYRIWVKAFSRDDMGGEMCDGRDITIHIVDDECNGQIEDVVLYKWNSDGSIQDLVSLIDGGTYQLSDLPDEFAMRAIVSGNIESVKLMVGGDAITENLEPYTYPAGGAMWNPEPGTYNVWVKAYAQDNLEGEMCDGRDFTIHIIDEICTGQIEDVVFYKWNSDGSIQDLVSLIDGGTYQLSDLPDEFAMRAIVSGNIESVKLMVGGDAITENLEPYTYPAGGAMWNPEPGTYNVWVKAYAQDNLEGEMCDGRDFTIHIIDEICTGQIEDVVLYTWNSDGSIQDLLSLENGGIYSLDNLPANFAMRAIVSGNIESVKLMVGGDAVTDNEAPYTYPADGAYWNPGPGQYNVWVKAFRQDNLGGEMCDGRDFTVNFIEECTATIDDIVLYQINSAGEFETITSLEDGATYYLSELPDNFGLEAIVSGNTESVKFDVNGDQIIENYYHYTYPAGDAPWNPTPGTYTINVKVFPLDGACGPVCDEETVTIIIEEEPPLLGSIGDFVFNDLNRNSIQDDGGLGIPFMTVELFDCDGNKLDEMLTDENGFYQFTDLPAGDYQLRFSNLPFGYEFSKQDQGTDDTIDNDADADGYTECVTLAAGENNMDVDAGICEIDAKFVYGDFVWNDYDMDGIQDPGEPGIEGVRIRMYDCTDGIEEFIAEEITDVDGSYLFVGDGLFEAFKFKVDNLPPGFVFSPQDAGSDDAQDSDADPQTGETVCYQRGAGGVPIIDYDFGAYESGGSAATILDVNNNAKSSLNTNRVISNPMAKGNVQLQEKEDIKIGKDKSVLLNEEYTGDEVLLSVFPNPSSNLFNISIQTKSIEPIHVSVFNSTGQEVYRQTISADLSQLQINARTFANGIYVLKVTDGTWTKSVKLIKTK